MALEIAAFRIIGKTFGSALRETTAVIAVFLGAMSIGYWLGGRAGDRWPRARTLIVIFLTAAATLVVVPWLDAGTSPRIAASELDFAMHAFLATTILFAIPTVLFASISPIAIRLMATTTGESGSNAGSISAVSTAGSIFGSIITAFFLIDWLASIARTVLFVAIGACLTAAMLALASLPRLRTDEGARRGVRRYAMIAVLTIAVTGLPAAFFIRSTRLEQSLMQQSPNWRNVFVGDSPYHRVIVRESKFGTRTLAFSAGVGIQSKMNLNDPYGPGLPYADAVHIPRLIRPATKKILNIGLGGATLAKQFVHQYPDTVVDVVELDPMVIDVAKRFFKLELSDRLRVHLSDGRMFLKRSNAKWDLIVIDAYTTNRYGDTTPPHLVTQEFFREVAAHLEPGGIVVFHCAFEQSRFFLALQKTMSSVFPHVRVAAGEIYGSDVPFLASKETLAERARGLRLPYLPRYLDSFGPRPPAPNSIPLLTDDFSPVDTLIRQR